MAYRELQCLRDPNTVSSQEMRPMAPLPLFRLHGRISARRSGWQYHRRAVRIGVRGRNRDAWIHSGGRMNHAAIAVEPLA